MSIVPGQLIPLLVEKPAAGGRMIARVGGQVVLVSAAIPGERLTARVERIGKGVVYAQAVSDRGRVAPIAANPSPICCAGAASTRISRIPGSSRSRRRSSPMRSRASAGWCCPAPSRLPPHVTTGIGCGRGCTSARAAWASFARGPTRSATPARRGSCCRRPSTRSTASPPHCSRSRSIRCGRSRCRRTSMRQNG